MQIGKIAKSFRLVPVGPSFPKAGRWFFSFTMNQKDPEKALREAVNDAEN
jgi:hypothetical protein